MRARAARRRNARPRLWRRLRTASSPARRLSALVFAFRARSSCLSYRSAAANHDRQRSFASDSNGGGMSLPADSTAQALCHWQAAAVKDCQAQEGLMRCGWPVGGGCTGACRAFESAQDSDRFEVAGLPHGSPAGAKIDGASRLLTVAARHRRRHRSKRGRNGALGPFAASSMPSNLLN
jgi:hypothetical protein